MFYLEHVIFGTALIGSSVAAAYDLKTTEVPNNVFYAILLVGIPAVLMNAFLTGNFDGFFLSGATGLGLFGIGYLMYRVGQWGGADMVLLALIGFLVPSVASMFPASTFFPFGISFLINLFIVGAVYMIGYSMVYASMNRGVIDKFRSGIKASSRLIAVVAASMAVLFTSMMLYLSSLVGDLIGPLEVLKGVALPIALTVSFLFVYRFAQAVENFGFKKRIRVSQLREGDMLLDERKLVGITEDQLRKIRRSGNRMVWIKEGVRFAPAFPLALLFTLFFGDAVTLLASFV